METNSCYSLYKFLTLGNLSRNPFWRHLMGILLVKKSLDLKFVKAIQPLKVRTVWTWNLQKAETQTNELTTLENRSNKSILVIFHRTMTATMAFCYQNCSDILWERIVLGIEKNFWNSRLQAENLQNFLRSLEQFIQAVKGQNNFW